MSEREFDCYCDDLEYQQSNGKHTHREVYSMCQLCWDKIDAEECVLQFFKDKSKYDAVTLEELQQQIQELNVTVSIHKQFIKLLQEDIKSLRNKK